MFRTAISAVIPALLLAVVPFAVAQHVHEEGQAKPATVSLPVTYDAAVAEIEQRLQAISVLMEAKDLDKVHQEAEVIQKIGNGIGQLALKADSGVPKDAVKQVNVTGKELAGKFDAIDRAADSGDAAGTRKVCGEMVTLTALLRKFDSPTSYQRAVAEINYSLGRIADLMKSKDLEKVHAEAEVIQRIGNSIGQLALKENSGVPKGAVKEINVTGKALAGKFDAIDKAADAGDAAGTQKVYDEMVKLAAVLNPYAPRSPVH